MHSPQVYPISSLTFNYAPVAVGIVLFICFVFWWLPCIGAMHWFQGPPHVPDAHVEVLGDEESPAGLKPQLPAAKPTGGDDSAHRGAAYAPPAH
jgi:hypothetical protein